MAVYEADEIAIAEEDLDVALTMKNMIDSFKGQMRHVGRHLNKNTDQIDAFCDHLDDAFDDTLGCIIALAYDAGASETAPPYKNSDLKNAERINILVSQWLTTLKG